MATLLASAILITRWLVPHDPNGVAGLLLLLALTMLAWLGARHVRRAHEPGGSSRSALIASEADVDALERLRHSDRVATLGRMAASVAHELGNPLNVIELRAQLITSGATGTVPQAQRHAEVIIEQTRRMTRIIDGVLSFVRTQPAQPERVDLAIVLRKAVALCAHASKKQHAQILLEAPDAGLEIDGDADKLLQVIVNLLSNGIQAMPRGGTLRVSTADEQCLPPGSSEASGACARPCLRIDVADQGLGIAREHLGRVFDPFFSTKHATGGTGLGLSVAQGLIQEHAGWITVHSELGHGAVFRVHLPRRLTHAEHFSTQAPLHR